jgi:hypothetical protein
MLLWKSGSQLTGLTGTRERGAHVVSFTVGEYVSMIPRSAPRSSEKMQKELLWQVDEHLQKPRNTGRVLQRWPKREMEPIWIKRTDHKVDKCLALVGMRKPVECPNEW